MAPQLSLRLPLQNLADQRGVGFAFGEFHHLAFEGIERGDFARLVIHHGRGIRSDGFIAAIFQSRPCR